METQSAGLGQPQSSSDGYTCAYCKQWVYNDQLHVCRKFISFQPNLYTSTESNEDKLTIVLEDKLTIALERIAAALEKVADRIH